MDIVALAMSIGVRANLLIKGVLQQHCHLDLFCICFINR